MVTCEKNERGAARSVELLSMKFDLLNEATCGKVGPSPSEQDTASYEAPDEKQFDAKRYGRPIDLIEKSPIQPPNEAPGHEPPKEPLHDPFHEKWAAHERIRSPHQLHGPNE